MVIDIDEKDVKSNKTGDEKVKTFACINSIRIFIEKSPLIANIMMPIIT